MYRRIYALIFMFLLYLPIRAGAAITLVGTPTSGYSGGGPAALSLSLPLGGTTATADTLEVIGCGQIVYGGPSNLPTPSGWTLIPNIAAISSQTTGIGFYKIFLNGASIPSTVSIQDLASDGFSIGCMGVAYTGYNGSSPFDTITGTQTNTSTTAATSTAVANVTTTASGDKILMYGALTGDPGAGATISFAGCASTCTVEAQVNRGADSGNGQFTLGDMNQASAGATGAGVTHSWAGGSSTGTNGQVTWITAIAPASVSPSGQAGQVIVP